MSKTVPNQNIVIIKKTKPRDNFLQISNEEWMKAAVDCDKSFNAFKIYLYLAANEIGYNKALSRQAIENALCIKSSSYYTSIDKLVELGYLVDIGGNKFEFYSTPFRSSGKIEKDLDSTLAENSVEMENSTLAENKNSALTENSIGMEKNQLSAEAENSILAEKVYETFNF
jgi:hypothetical protein